MDKNNNLTKRRMINLIKNFIPQSTLYQMYRQNIRTVEEIFEYLLQKESVKERFAEQTKTKLSYSPS